MVKVRTLITLQKTQSFPPRCSITISQLDYELEISTIELPFKIKVVCARSHQLLQ